MDERLFFLKGVNGQIHVYEDRIIIERGGFLGFMSQGLAGSKTIPMDSIMSVQFKEGNSFFNGFIQFGILGGREFQGGVFNATQDENTVMINRSTNNEAYQIKKYVEERILKRGKNQGTVVQQVSAADELKKFKELLDMGVITQEEFNAKKKQLLGM